VTLDLHAVVDSAARALDGSAGGVPVCTFTKAGQPVPGIKYAEGRWAALREAQRAHARGQAVGDAVAAVRADWAAAAEQLRTRGAGPDWIAYRSGGVDALDELIETMGAASR
jgi:hypothetical protein